MLTTLDTYRTLIARKEGAAMSQVPVLITVTSAVFVVVVLTAMLFWRRSLRTTTTEYRIILPGGRLKEYEIKAPNLRAAKQQAEAMMLRRGSYGYLVQQFFPRDGWRVVAEGSHPKIEQCQL